MDRHCPRIQWSRQMRSKKVDRRHQHQPAERAARQHHTRNADADDVAHAQVLRRHIRANRAALQQVLLAHVRRPVRLRRPQAKQILILKQRVQRPQTQPQKDPRGKRAAALPCHQHIRAGRALGIEQRSMLLHNQLPPQRNHEQHAQPATKQGQREDAGILQIEAKKDQCRQRKNHARSNRLPRIPRRLDDVVLQNRRTPQHPQNRNRQHRNRDGRRHRQTRPQPHIHRDRTKDDTKDRTNQDRAQGQLGPRLIRWNERAKGGVRLGRGNGAGGHRWETSSTRLLVLKPHSLRVERVYQRGPLPCPHYV